MRTRIFALALAASALAGCESGKTGGDTSAQPFTSEGDRVIVSADSPVASRLRLETVSFQSATLDYTATASVGPKAGSYAEVGLPFPGRVVKSYVRLGERITKGQTLFEVSSSDFMDAVRTYLENSNSSALAMRNLERKKTLHEAGVVSDKELEEARAEAEAARNSMELSRQVLGIFNADPSSVKVGEPLKVVAPISGTVVRGDIVIGQYLSEDSDAGVAIAALGNVWVTANVPLEVSSRISDSQEALVDAGDGIPGKIIYVGEILDEKTRTVPVVVECPNPERALKPGMFVSVSFRSAPSDRIVIPSSAVFQGDGTMFVYSQVESGVYRRTPVKVSGLDAGHQMVLDGLSEGDTIIADGGIYLSE